MSEQKIEVIIGKDFVTAVVLLVLSIAVFYFMLNSTKQARCANVTLLKYEDPNYLYQCEDNGVLFSKPFLIYSAKNSNEDSLVKELK